MRSAGGLRLGKEALPAVLAHGFETLRLPVIVFGHGVHTTTRESCWSEWDSSTHDILWSPKKIEVRMLENDCGELAIQESATICRSRQLESEANSIWRLARSTSACAT